MSPWDFWECLGLHSLSPKSRFSGSNIFPKKLAFWGEHFFGILQPNIGPIEVHAPEIWVKYANWMIFDIVFAFSPLPVFVVTTFCLRTTIFHSKGFVIIKMVTTSRPSLSMRCFFRTSHLDVPFGSPNPSTKQLAPWFFFGNPATTCDLSTGRLVWSWRHDDRPFFSALSPSRLGEFFWKSLATTKKNA